MCDDDGIVGCTRMGTGTTDANGNFTVTGTGANPDIFSPDPPDVVMRVVATGPSGRVQNTTLGDYCFRTTPVNNVLPGPVLSFGTLTPNNSFTCDLFGNPTSTHNGAWQLYNDVREEWELMRLETLRTPGRDIPQVRVIWPDNIGNATFYRPPLPGIDEGSISIAPSGAFDSAVTMHEFGHHVLQHFGESPLPDYNNGVCDSVNFLMFGGHCLWRAEKGAVAWTEGWPDFLSEFMTTTLGKSQTVSSSSGCDIIVPTLCGSIEAPPQPSPDPNLSNVEGTVAAILWDLVDTPSDNHDANGSTDRLDLTFSALWDLYRGFDPDPFTGHNSILNLDELWNGFASLRPTELNRVSEIYHENGLTKPAANLRVSGLTVKPASVVRGRSVSVRDETVNSGAVRTGVSSVTRYSLVPASGFGVLTPLGSRTVNELGPSTSSIATTSVMIPLGTAPNQYVVRACADDTAGVFKTNEREQLPGQRGLRGRRSAEQRRLRLRHGHLDLGRQHHRLERRRRQGAARAEPRWQQRWRLGVVVLDGTLVRCGHDPHRGQLVRHAARRVHRVVGRVAHAGRRQRRLLRRPQQRGDLRGHRRHDLPHRGGWLRRCARRCLARLVPRHRRRSRSVTGP